MIECVSEQTFLFGRRIVLDLGAPGPHDVLCARFAHSWPGELTLWVEEWTVAAPGGLRRDSGLVRRLRSEIRELSSDPGPWAPVYGMLRSGTGGGPGGSARSPAEALAERIVRETLGLDAYTPEAANRYAIWLREVSPSLFQQLMAPVLARRLSVAWDDVEDAWMEEVMGPVHYAAAVRPYLRERERLAAEVHGS